MKHGLKKKQSSRFWMYTFLTLFSLVWIIPIVTVFMTSLKSRADFFSGMGLFEFPAKAYWQNYKEAMVNGKLGMYMKNGALVSFLKVPLGIFIEALAAFALTRLEIKNRTGLFVFFLIGMMLPMQVALVPLNTALSRLKLTNTYFGLFYIYVGFGISYGILILRGFFNTIPKDIDEAAYIDGCSRWRLFWNIILPIGKPAIATLFIMDFLSTWNEYLLASVFMTDNHRKTVAAGLMTFVGEHGTDYGLLSAGVLISIIPVLIVYIFFQRYFMEGLAGAVKG